MAQPTPPTPAGLGRMSGALLSSLRRLLLSAVVGASIAVIGVIGDWKWELAVLAAWNASAVTFLVCVWPIAVRSDGARTASIATIEDDSRQVAAFILLVASSASMVGVIFGLHAANHASGFTRVVLTGAVISTVVCSWLVVQTEYTLYYAHLYYRVVPGGICFPGEDAPDYRDFAYLAVTLGMTFQVSDNTIETREIRRAVTGHCLLSYVFGTVIIATTINVVAGLVGAS